jgi:hypothetical protein
MAGDIISEEGRRARFERWEQLGLSRIKADLQNGGHQVVGGTQAVQDLAWEWIGLKEAEQAAAAKQQKKIEIRTPVPRAPLETSLNPPRFSRPTVMACDLPLKFHPRAIRASAGFKAWGAGGATCDRRSWSGLRSRSRVVERLAA